MRWAFVPILVCLLGVAIVNCELNLSGNLQYVYSKVDPAIQEQTATGVIQRLLPARWTEFVIRVEPSLTSSVYKDAFSIDWDNSTEQLIVSGTTGVSALFGFNYYLKYFCNAQVAWEGTQLNLPVKLPRVSLRKPIADRFRYYQNACTDSYSFSWWKWQSWERQIDWMSLNGINMPLAFTGQEAIWQKVYLSLGLSLADVDDYMTGPAFLAWWRMGNLQRWGGRIPQSYVTRKGILLKWITQRMRNLGMTPVLPAFSGNVPAALTKLYPNSTFHQHPNWAGFNSTFSRTYMLDPSDPLFLELGKKFMTQMIKDVGTDHVYNCDTFNENKPSQGDPEFLRNYAKATFKSMTLADPKAVWMIQSWIFMDTGFWNHTRVQSYLSGVQVGNLIVLDLFAETTPLFSRFDSFFNHTFIWCMLHNFGGTMNLFGVLDSINEKLPEARKAARPGTLIGTGTTPEGINQNYVMYDFMTEMSLNEEPIDTEQWIFNYSTRRYGKDSEALKTAWNILRKGAYNAPAGQVNHGHSVLSSRPGISSEDYRWYDPNDLKRVISFFLTESKSSLADSPLYQHDLVDFTRQFLVYLVGFIHKDMMTAYSANATVQFKNFSLQLLEAVDDLDVLLKSSKDFLLGSWLKDAEGWGDTEEEKRLLSFNALNQITLWGPSGEILDYAMKQWSGVVSNYHKPRWELFIEDLESSLGTSLPFNVTDYNRKVLTQVETPFSLLFTADTFPSIPQGNSLDQVTRIYKRWRKTYSGAARSHGINQKATSWVDIPRPGFNSFLIHFNNTIG